jgi:hypothetical protein
LEGEGLGAKPRPELIGPVLTAAHDTLLDTVRMGFLHSSRTPGRIPRALQQAADVRYLGHSAGPDGSTDLHFELPEFGSVAAELFEQGQLWETGPKADETAFDLLSAALTDVRQLANDSARFDHALLHRFSRYRRFFGRGLTSITLPDAEMPSAIDAELSAAAESLYRQTPPARRVRVAGRLDMLGVSKHVLGIFLENGTALTAVWTGEQFTDLAKFLDRQVLIEGLAQYRPSGSLLRVDAEAIAEATAQDSFFSVVPQPETRREYVPEVVRVRPSQAPYAAIFGFVPSGGESDEAYAAAVEDFS